MNVSTVWNIRQTAIAADHAVTDTALPVFDLDDTGAIADFIETTVELVRG